MMLVSDGNLSFEQIREARVTRLLTHELLYVQDTKFVKLALGPVFLFFFFEKL